MNNEHLTSDTKRRTILVTGGAGYIGSITAKTLLDNGFEVVVLDSLEKGHLKAVDSRATLEIADLADRKRTDQIFKKHKIDAVIDFAAYIAVGESMTEPKKYLENNVFNFISLLDTMTENGIQFLIKSSTASVYGTPDKEADLPLVEKYTEILRPVHSALLEGEWENKKMSGDEFFNILIGYYNERCSNSKLKLAPDEISKLKIPTSVYGFTKLLDEILMKKYDDLFGLKSIILRYFNVAGADPSGDLGQDNDNPTHIFASAIFQALGKRDKLTVFGKDYPTKDGTGIRDYIHVNDLARGHVTALNYLFKNKKSDTFNLGTGHGYSVLEVIAAVGKASGKKINFEFGPHRSGDVSAIYSDPTKANNILSWKAEYSLDDMAESAWKWHHSHPNGFAISKS